MEVSLLYLEVMALQTLEGMQLCLQQMGEGNIHFYSLGHQDANGSTKDNGAVIFSYASSGKLSIVNGLVVIFKDQIEKQEMLSL
jgi:hypothetical protein